MSDHRYGIETLCLHAGQLPDPGQPAAVPRRSTRRRATSSTAPTTRRACSPAGPSANVYSRDQQSDGGDARRAHRRAGERPRLPVAWPAAWRRQLTPSRRSLRPATNRRLSQHLYGGPIRVSTSRLRKRGIETTFVPTPTIRRTSAARCARTPASSMARRSATRRSNVLDIAPVRTIAHEHGVAADESTTDGPRHTCPAVSTSAADIVVHSVTK